MPDQKTDGRPAQDNLANAEVCPLALRSITLTNMDRRAKLLSPAMED